MSPEPYLATHREYWADRIDDLYKSWKSTVNALDTTITGSVADYEDQHLSHRHPSWRRDESSTAGFFAVQTLEIAAHYMIGIRCLIAGGVLTIAPTALVRSVTENVSQAVWILDPEIDAETRIARLLLSQFEGAWHYKEALSKRSDKSTADARRLREEVRELIKSRFPDSQLPERGSRISLEESRVGYAEYVPWSKKCRRLTDLINENGNAPHGLYDTLSTLVHPNPVVMTTLIKAQRNPSEPEFSDMRCQWEREAQIASELFYAGGSAACNFFGLDPINLDEWANYYKNCDGSDIHE